MTTVASASRAQVVVVDDLRGLKPEEGSTTAVVVGLFGHSGRYERRPEMCCTSTKHKEEI
jgi:hypothetical protein